MAPDPRKTPEISYFAWANLEAIFTATLQNGATERPAHWQIYGLLEDTDRTESVLIDKINAPQYTRPASEKPMKYPLLALALLAPAAALANQTADVAAYCRSQPSIIQSVDNAIKNPDSASVLVDLVFDFDCKGVDQGAPDALAQCKALLVQKYAQYCTR